MQRDPFSEFADAPGPCERIEAALDWREERAASNADWRILRGLLRFWNSQGGPEIPFALARETGEPDVAVHRYRRVGDA